jgi:pimeloyl-ACP methyl ester carboxylesterase
MSLVIQGVNVYLTDCGSGSPLLFLHGAPDSAEMWSGVLEQLKDQHRCFAPDLPGFGRSAAPADFSCSLENMACFLDELIEEAAIPTPLNLVVADFGATYGLSWAVTSPHKIGRLAIVGGSNQSMPTNLGAHTLNIFLRTVTGLLLRLRGSSHNDSLLSLLKGI